MFIFRTQIIEAVESFLPCWIPHEELSGDYLDHPTKDKIATNYIKTLNHLGYEVILQEGCRENFWHLLNRLIHIPNKEIAKFQET